MPLDMQSALIFHYNLKFYNNDTDNYDGVSLKRFVMQVTIQKTFGWKFTAFNAISIPG